jgi:hypothetical protein
MTLPEVPVIEHRIAHLIEHDQFRIASQAVRSFMNRLQRLNTRASGLPFADRNAFQSVLYNHLEKVLSRFEELESLGPHSGPVPIRDRASEAMHAYGVRSNKIDDCLERLPVEAKLATSAVLHRELEQALTLFENHRWLRNRRVQQNMPQSRLRWN